MSADPWNRWWQGVRAPPSADSGNFSVWCDFYARSYSRKLADYQGKHAKLFTFWRNINRIACSRWRQFRSESDRQTHQNQSRPILAFSQALTVRVCVGEILKDSSEILSQNRTISGSFWAHLSLSIWTSFEGSLDRSNRTFRNCDEVNNMRALESSILCNDINKKGILR